MRRVTVRFLGHLNRAFKIQKHAMAIDVEDDGSVGDLLNKLEGLIGQEFKKEVFDPKSQSIQPGIRIMINGRDIDFLENLATRLNNGDTICIFMPVVGG